MTKKPSLAGRKRTGDLGDMTGAQAKKEELRALQESNLQADKPAEQQPTEQPTEQQPVELPVEPPEESPVEEAIHAVAQVVEESIGSLVEELKSQYQKLAKAGTKFKRQYSRFQQNQVLVSTIGDKINTYADHLLSQGIEPTKIHQDCQARADEIRRKLNEEGVQLSPLRVMPRPQSQD